MKYTYYIQWQSDSIQWDNRWMTTSESYRFYYFAKRALLNLIKERAGDMFIVPSKNMKLRLVKTWHDSECDCTVAQTMKQFNFQFTNGDL